EKFGAHSRSPLWHGSPSMPVAIRLTCDEAHFGGRCDGGSRGRRSAVRARRSGGLSGQRDRAPGRFGSSGSRRPATSCPPERENGGVAEDAAASTELLPDQGQLTSISKGLFIGCIGFAIST